MSDYTDALRGFPDVDWALSDAYRPGPANLPSVYGPAAVVHQPVPLPEPRRGLDPWSVRLLSGGGAVCLCGAGVDLAGAGIRAAGPYLWALAAALGALGALIAVLKSRTGGVPGAKQITVTGSRNVRIHQ